MLDPFTRIKDISKILCFQFLSCQAQCLYPILDIHCCAPSNHLVIQRDYSLKFERYAKNN